MAEVIHVVVGPVLRSLAGVVHIAVVVVLFHPLERHIVVEEVSHLGAYLVVGLGLLCNG